MGSSKRVRKMDQNLDLQLACFETEDRVVAYLDKLPPWMALAIALNVELTLAVLWGREQQKMIRHRDPREVVAISPSHLDELEAKLATLPCGLRSDPAAEQHIFGLFPPLPPDRAWWLAHRVVTWAEAQT
jgi:hypothetical protein